MKLIENVIFFFQQIAYNQLRSFGSPCTSEEIKPKKHNWMKVRMMNLILSISLSM